MEIDLYRMFEKKPNSTKRPTNSDTHITLTGNLREPCSISAPVFKIKRLNPDQPPARYNYAFIPYFARYYFITDWVWAEGLWECHCEVDVLASWRPYIGAMNAYIERSAYNYDGAIIDTVYPSTTNLNVQETYINTPWGEYTDPDEGCYVIGVIGKSASASLGTAVTYYALTASQMDTLTSYLFSDTFYDSAGFPQTGNTEPISHKVAMAMINPLQYIVSCNWFPHPISGLGESQTRRIYVGPYETIGYGHYLGGSAGYEHDFDISIPVHPQAPTRGKYLMYSPYTKLTLILPPFGTIPVDTSYFEVDDKINVNIAVDCVTGKARLYLGVKKVDPTLDKKRFYETSAQFGVPIQLAQQTTDYLKIATSVINTISQMGGMGTGASTLGLTDHMAKVENRRNQYSPVYPLSEVAKGYAGVMMAHSGLMALGSVGDAISASFPQLISSGLNGSFVSFWGTALLTARHSILVDENNDECGRPLCEIRRIDTLPGFIKCGEVSIDFGCLAEESVAIRAFLLNGFFWEVET